MIGMKWLALFLGMLLALSFVHASDVDVSVDVAPKERTFATMLPFGALLLGLLVPIPIYLFLKNFFTMVLEEGVTNFRTFTAVVFGFATFVMIMILLSYAFYYLTRPV